MVLGAAASCQSVGVFLGTCQTNVDDGRSKVTIESREYEKKHTSSVGELSWHVVSTTVFTISIILVVINTADQAADTNS